MANGMIREGGASDLDPGNSSIINAFENLLRAGNVDESNIATTRDDINHIARLHLVGSYRQSDANYLFSYLVDGGRAQRVSDALGRALSAILGPPVDLRSQAQECSVPLLGSGIYAVKQANLKAALEQLNKIDPEAATLYKWWFELSTDPKAIEPQAQRDPTWRNHQAMDGNLMNQMFASATTELTQRLRNSPNPTALQAYESLISQAGLSQNLLNNLQRTDPRALGSVLQDMRDTLRRIANSDRTNPGVL